MIYTIVTPDLQSALKRLGDLMEKNENTIVFCGDRYTLLVEQTICARLGGTFSASILTFARYLRSYVSERMLSKYGSVMTVRRLLSEKSGLLQCFHGEADVAEGIYDTIIRLSASKVTAKDLEEANLSDNPVLDGKIKDIALLQDEYEKFLFDHHYLDESSYFRLLPEVIRAEKSFEGKHVVLFGFPSFASQMKEGIRACIETANDTSFFFIGGEEAIYRNEAEANVADLIEGRAHKRQYFALPVIDEVKHMREGLFNPQKYGESPRITDKISLYEADGVYSEVERIAGEISRSIRLGKRFRDEVVLVPSLSEYALPIRSIFESYKIPYFIDLKKSMREHPLSHYLLSALEMTADGFSLESVLDFASNPYFGRSDQFRSYLSEYASFRGGVKRELKQDTEYEYGELKFYQDRLLKSVMPRTAEGQEYVSLLSALLNETDRTTNDLLQKLDDPADQNYLSRGKELIQKVLAEAETLTNGYLMTADEMEKLLSDGLSALEVSMIPLKADAVFIGDLENSKFLPVPDLYVLGLTDVVPKVTEDTALLLDRDLALLSREHIEIEPTSAQSNLRTKESVALNLCSFTEHLSCFVPLESGRGKSDVMNYLSRLFSETGANGLLMSKAEDVSLSMLSYFSTTNSLALKQLLLKKIDMDNGKQTEGSGALYRALQKKGEERTDAYYQGIEREPYIGNGEKLFFGKGTISPTLLETYYTCPYRNFISQGLKAKETKEGSIESKDTGNFVHAVLERLAGEIQNGNVHSYETCEEVTKSIATELLKTPPYAYAFDTESGTYAMNALVEETLHVTKAMYRTIEQSSFSVSASEKVIKTGDLYGKIDRVDESGEYVRVVDYKTGSFDASPESYYTGQKIQLPLYLSAVSEGKTPTGAFYFPATYTYHDSGENFKMVGFFNEPFISLSDREWDGRKSELFDKVSERSGRRLPSDSFQDFIDYSHLLKDKASEELKKGFIGASPYESCPSWCALKGTCRSEGDRVRNEGKVTCMDIAVIAKRSKEKS